MSDVRIQSTYTLPALYEDNHIVLLARDPHWLFAYWEISSERRQAFIKEFGTELWERSIPVLKVTNVSKNISFDIRINDFASNWYINVDHSGSLYVAELGRKVSDQFFLSLASSNYVNTPDSTVSSNTTAFFINYNDLKKGVLDADKRKIYEATVMKQYAQTFTGPSSPELIRSSQEESALGISSAELFGINLAKQLGISSANLLDRK